MTSNSLFVFIDLMPRQGGAKAMHFGASNHNEKGKRPFTLLHCSVVKFVLNRQINQAQALLCIGCANRTNYGRYQIEHREDNGRLPLCYQMT